MQGPPMWDVCISSGVVDLHVRIDRCGSIGSTRPAVEKTESTLRSDAVVVLVETEAWLNTVANRKEQSGLRGTASGGADEAVQQMNRSIDTSPVNGYGSSVVKVKNLKGEEEDMRKILSIFIAVCLVLSLFTGIFVSIPSARALSEGDFEYSVLGTAPNQTVTITGYTGSGGAIDIPNTLGRYPVTSIGTHAFHDCTALTRVSIPNSITNIDAQAFQGCAALTAAFFLGNAPTMGTGVFDSCATGFTVGHIGGTTGWTNPWFTYPTDILNTTTYTLTLIVTGSGSIAKFPDQSLYIPGSIVTLTATPATGYTFTGWSRDLTGTTNPITITMTGNKTVTATFANISMKTVIVLHIGKSTFTVNGISNSSLDSPPLIKNGRTLVPVRTIIEALRGSVGWDGTARKATVTLGSTTIELWIGKNVATVNGKNTPIDSTNAKVVPEIISGRTMLPLRFVSENLGCTVLWAAATKTITITYTP